MRILYIPQMSNKLLNASSSYNFFSVFSKAVLKEHPDTIFYFVKPQIIGSKYHESEQVEFPNTIIVPVEAYENQIDDVLLVSKNFYNLFNERRTDFYFDVIFNEKVANASIIRQIAMFCIWWKSVNPLIVNRDQFIISKWIVDAEYANIDDWYELNEALWRLTAPTIFQSPQQARVAELVTKKYFRPKLFDKLKKNIKIFPLWIDCDEVDKITAWIKKNDVKTVTFSSKLYNGTKYQDSLEVMDKVFTTSKSKIDVQVITASWEMVFSKPDNKKFCYMRRLCNAWRKEFLEESAKAHIFISNCIYQDFSMTMTEQLYMWLLPVLPDVAWSKYLLPEWYPYLFKTKDEQIAMIKHIAENYDDLYKERVPKIRKKIKEEFDLSNVSLKIYDYFEELIKERNEKYKISDSIKEVFNNAIWILPDRFTADDFYEAIRKCSAVLDVEKDLENRSHLTKLYALNIIQLLWLARLTPNIHYLEFEKIKK